MPATEGAAEEEPMGMAAHDQRRCTRCQEWKHVSHFHAGMAMPESEHVCRDCFPDWLDEQEAARKREMH
jgi:hypothetical protein